MAGAWESNGFLLEHPLRRSGCGLEAEALVRSLEDLRDRRRAIKADWEARRRACEDLDARVDELVEMSWPLLAAVMKVAGSRWWRRQRVKWMSPMINSPATAKLPLMADLAWTAEQALVARVCGDDTGRRLAMHDYIYK
jgi:hypothetical protein